MIMIIILGAFSPLSSLGDIGRMLVNVQGAFTPSATNTPPEEPPVKDDDVEVPNQNRYNLLQSFLFFLREMLNLGSFLTT